MEPNIEQDNLLNGMEFEELIKIAASNQNIEVISEIMKSKFQVHKRTIFMAGEKTEKILSGFPHEDEMINIRDIDVAIKFISNFGNLITKLRFFGPSFKDSLKSYELFKMVNFVCVNLVEVELPINWSSMITKPFDNVKKLSIVGYAIVRLNLNAHYPNLEELWMTTLAGSAFIIQNIPNLKKLVYFHDEKDVLIKPFLKTNPQLEVIISNVYFPLPMLEEITANLPKLQTLSFNITSKSTKSIHQQIALISKAM